MSGKRFNDSNSHVFDKGGNSNGVGRNGNMLGTQGNKQRTRLTGGTANAKLSVPRPVNLPSLRKESQGHEAYPPSNPPTSGTTGWQRPEEHPSQETWSQHVAPKQPVGTFHRLGLDDITKPTLDQAEFPTLEAAAHTKNIAAKMKPQKSTTSPERRPSKEFAEDDRPPTQPPPRASWEEDERFGVSAVPMTYAAAPVYMPMGTQGLPSDAYLHPPYFPRPYYAPSPRTPGQGFRPDYYQPAEGMYPPYIQMYSPPMYAGYPHPEMYGDPGVYPLPPPPKRITNTEFDVEKTEVELELPSVGRERSSQLKTEAEHPRTPDKSSGEGTLILTKRQSDDRLQSDAKSTLRRMSLPKDNSLALSRPSEELDWEAQVDAEERAKERKEIKILRRPSHESNQSASVDRTAKSEAEQPSWRSKECPVERNKRWSHSPLRQDVHRRDNSVDAMGRPMGASSDVGMPHTAGHSHRRQPTRPRTLTPPVHPVPRPEFDPREPEVWRDHREMPRRGRGFGRGFGRGRSPGRGHRWIGARGDRQRSPVVAAPGRRLFPGRGFRPSRQARSFDANENFDSWKSRRELTDAERGQPTATIQFGEFDVSVTGNFDPFSDDRPPFKGHGLGHKKNDRSRDVDAGVEVHPMEGSHSSRPDRRTGRMDMSFVGTVLDDIDRVRKEKTPGSEYGSDRGSFIGRSPRGRDHRRGGRFPNNLRGRSFGRSGEHDSPFTDGDFEYDTFDSGDGYGGRHPDWRRRHSGDNPSFRGRRGWRGDRGGRSRGRGRDAGRFQRHQVNVPLKSHQPKMQWVPKKTSPAEDKTEE